MFARRQRRRQQPTAAPAGRRSAALPAIQSFLPASLVVIQESYHVAELLVVAGELLLHVIPDLGIGGVAIGFQKTLELVALDNGSGYHEQSVEDRLRQPVRGDHV